MTTARLPRLEIVRAARTAASQNSSEAKRLEALAVMAHNCLEDGIAISLDDFMLLADHYRSK